jgi:hypothetical protein
MSRPHERGGSIFSSGASIEEDREVDFEVSSASSSQSESDPKEADNSSEQATDSDDLSSPFHDTSGAESSSDSEYDGVPPDHDSDFEGSLRESDDNGTNGGISNRDVTLKRDDPAAAAWLKHTAQERAICDAIEREDDTNLTKHIINAHGFYANRYSPNGRSYEPVNRQRWISEWHPPASWTAWPMPPELVPRRQHRVWNSSIMMNERWVPSRDLENEIFACLLKKSRHRWKRRFRESHERKIQPSSGKSKSYLLPGRKPAEDREEGENHESYMHRHPENSSENDDIVFSADDDKSWAVARQVVRSILTDFDSILLALHSSVDGVRRGPDERQSLFREGSKPGVKSSRQDENNLTRLKVKKRRKTGIEATATRYNSLDRDWSHVLSMASIAGISPRVISRATVRCSAIFNENMIFRSIPEQDASEKLIDPESFRSSDFSSKFADKRLQELPMTWDESEGCPFPNCNWYRQKHPRSRVMQHMREKHKWDPYPFDLDFQASVSGMVGGVHVDGFLQPVNRPKRGRGRDECKGKNETRSQYMKRRWDAKNIQGPKDVATGDDSKKEGNWKRE